MSTYHIPDTMQNQLHALSQSLNMIVPNLHMCKQGLRELSHLLQIMELVTSRARIKKQVLCDCKVINNNVKWALHGGQ